MPLNKEAYIRYRIIDTCIGNKHKPFPSMDDLIEACEDQLGKKFTISTIQKDIKTLKEDEALGFMAPIKYSKSENGYYYADENYSIRNLPLNEEEIESLLAVTDLLSTFSGSRVSDNFGVAVDKIMATVKEKYEKVSGKRVLIQTENPPKQRGWEHFELFFKASKNKIPVSFAHYSYTKRVFNAIILHPYLLKEFQNKWYIIGYSENHKSIRCFGLDRVLEPILLKHPFHMVDDFDPIKHFNDIYGVFPITKKKELIEFRITSFLSSYFQSQPLHESQKVIKYSANGSLLLSLNLIPSQELINHFFMLNKHISILKPEWIKKELDKMHKSYQDEKIYF